MNVNIDLIPAASIPSGDPSHGPNTQTIASEPLAPATLSGSLDFTLGLRVLHSEIQRILESALRPSTRRSYAAKWWRFSSFAESRSFSPHSASIADILQFLLELHHSGLKRSSIKVFTAAISYYCGTIHITAWTYVQDKIVLLEERFSQLFFSNNTDPSPIVALRRRSTHMCDCTDGHSKNISYSEVHPIPHLKSLGEELVAVVKEPKVLLLTPCPQPIICLRNPTLLEYIMQKARLDESQARTEIAGRNISNYKYADDTTLMAESEEELKRLLMRVKEESAKVGLKLNNKKTKIMASAAITSWHGDDLIVTPFAQGSRQRTSPPSYPHNNNPVSCFYPVLIHISGFQ
ncbi:putative uncharacterized transposon-derived protein F52C9.6 [Varanus komodoensis]|nr:putative uncharacterized transposon-derived protein F52C9.6 [Varanus komodoensis]